MSDEWMPVLRWKLSLEQFHQLPRNPAYKYEYLKNYALLTPRPKHYHARLPLAAPAEEPAPVGSAAEATLRPLCDDDWPQLENVFQAAFHRTQPFASCDEETLARAAHKCLERTRTGGDGPWLEQASFVAERAERAIGSILVTLLPNGDPRDFESYYWREPPPENAVARRMGRPHLTWIFVSPWFAGLGLGTHLLHRAVRALLELGYTELLSTFLVGNDSSMLWHWRNGFELLTYPGSVRYMHNRWERHNTGEPEA